MRTGPAHLSVALARHLGAGPVRVRAKPGAAERRLIVQLTATASLLMAAVAGVGLGTGTATLAACAALLILGLPHGSFDLLLLIEAARAGRARLTALLLLYLGLGAAMAALWWTLPTVALGLFLALAVMHFAEDWREAGSSFVAQGIALAIIAAPSLFHPREIAGLLGAVATASGGVLLGAALTTVAPVAVVLALVGLAMTARAGAGALAAGGVVALAGLLALPPLIGFALFFCLLHSPLHFTQASSESGRATWRRWAPVVAPVTLLALGVTGALYWFGSGTDLSPSIVQAIFRTLSILTLPHLAMPVIVTRWSLLRAANPPARA